MLIFCPNFLTGSDEMYTEKSELRSLLLLVTTCYFVFHSQIKTQFKAERYMLPIKPKELISSHARSTASTHLYH